MALPVLTRTWQFSVNELSNGAGSQLAQCRNLLFTIKERLKAQGSWTDSAGAAATPSSGWTVIGSSSAAAAGMDGVDRIAAVSNLNWESASNAHSWIVLQQTGIGSLFQVLISCNSNSSSPEDLKISCSHTGFGTANGGTNGSTTADPTALNEVTVQPAGTTSPWGGPAGDFASRLHVLRAADGTATRVFITRNGVLCGAWMFERAGNPVTGWTNQYWAFAQGQDTNAPSASVPHSTQLTLNTNAKGFGTSAMNMYLSVEGAAGNEAYDIMTSANSLSLENPFFPIGLLSPTIGQQGRHGLVVDMWYGLSSLPSAETYPDTGTLKQFCQLGILINPWNRSTPIFSA